MEINRQELEKVSVHSLRDIARDIGVTASTSMAKDDLINAILDIKEGRAQPRFTKVGRPRLKTYKSGELKEFFSQPQDTEQIRKEAYEKAVDTLVEKIRKMLLNEYKR